MARQEDTASLRFQRKELVDTLVASGWRQPSDARDDELAETDWAASEAWVEGASGDALVTGYLQQRSVSEDDWFGAMRVLDPTRVAGGLLGDAGLPAPPQRGGDSATRQAIAGVAAWGKQWEAQTLAGFTDTWSDAETAARSLREFHTPAGLSNSVVGGLAFDNHLDRLMAVGSRDDLRSLDAGLFMADHPSLAVGLLDADARLRAGGLEGISLRAGKALGYVGQNMQAMYAGVLGTGFSNAAEGVTDHFKFMGSNLGDADAVLAIGSTNATMAALGTLDQRNGGRARARGGNVESLFVLAPGMMRDDAVFRSLSSQAANAAAWVTSGGLDPVHAGYQTELAAGGTRAELAGRLESLLGRAGSAQNQFVGPEGAVGDSRILSGQGLAQKHMEMLRNTGLRSATIITYNTGNLFLNEVRGALERGVKVTLMTGSRWDFENGPRMTDITEPTHVLEAFKKQMQAALTPEQFANLDLVQNHAQLVHAKVSNFDLGDQGLYSLYGSMNTDDEQFLGAYFDPSKAYGGPIRNLGIGLSSKDYDGLAREHELTRDVIDMARLMGGRPAGTTPFALANLDELAARFRGYQLNGRQAQVIPSQTTGLIDSVKFQVGGTYTVNDAQGRGFNIELGNLKSFTALSHVDAPDGSFFVPELTKFVGGVKGIGTLDKTTGLRSAARDVGALEVLAAGTAYGNQIVQTTLSTLAAHFGAAATQQMLADPIRRGYLRAAMGSQVRRVFENFAGVEPGTAVYDAKSYSRLGFGIDGNNRLDMSNPMALDAAELDAVLTGYAGGTDLGSGEFMFAAGGLSRHRSDGSRTPMRLYDLDMVKALPMGLRQKREDGQHRHLFLMPLNKLAQLPQRLQNIMSARALAVQEDASLLQALGVDGSAVNDLVATSRFVGEDGKVLRGIRIRGFAIPGMAGDNAYMIGEAFENVYVGNESWSRTVKIAKSGLAEGASAGVDFVNAVKEHGTQLRDAQGELDGRYFLSHQTLDALEYRLPVATHVLEGTGRRQIEEMDFKTDKLHEAGLVLDLNARTGTSLVGDNGGTWSFTVRGTTVRRMQSGDRAMIGGKFPFAFVQEQSRAIIAIRAFAKGLDPETYQALGYENAVGKDMSNAVFGMKTIKNGQALVETGIEVLSSGAWKSQLRRLGARGAVGELADLSGTLRRFATFAGDNQSLQREFMTMANRLDTVHLEGGQAAVMAMLEQHLGTSARYLSRNPNRRISMAKNLGVTGAAILAFGIHARGYMAAGKDAFESDSSAALAFHQAFNPDYEPGMKIEDLMASDRLEQMLMGVVPMTMVTAASATAVAMSSRNRINFLNYHAGGYTDAFLDLMAGSPELLEKQAAYRELVSGGLLGHGGRNDVRFGTEFNPMTRFVPGVTVTMDGHETNPYEEAMKLHQEVRVGLSGTGPATLEALRALQANRSRFETLNTLLNTELDDTSKVSRALGSPESAKIVAHRMVLEAAGVGARAFQVPRIGTRGVDGQVVVNAAATGHDAVVDFINVPFLSPQALRSTGGFEDFSPEVERLQVQIEQNMSVLSLIRDKNGVIDNRMNTDQQAMYRDLLDKVGRLQFLQKEAAATGLQKLMGGQLAMPGRNMVVGTLPGIKEGVMVLGTEAWRVLREGGVEDIVRGLEATVAGKSGRVQATREALTGLVRSLARTVGTEAAVTSAETLITGFSDSLAAQRTALRALESPELPGLRQERADLRREQRLLEQQAADYHLLKYGEAVRGQEVPRLRTSDVRKMRDFLLVADDHFRALVTDAQAYGELADDVHARIKALRKPGGINLRQSLSETVNSLLELPEFRSQLMKGVFQRAGAPFGPYGLVATEIMTAEEFNAGNPSLLIHGTLSQTSVFMNVNAMAYNLGDFDGDTGSVGHLKEWGYLQARQMLHERGLGPALGATELGRLRHAEEKLRLSPQETQIGLARHYTGWTDVFSEQALYIGGDARMQERFGRDTGAARDRLHALRARRNAGRTLGASGEAMLSAYESRETQLARLAVSGNEYVADMHAAHDEVRTYMMDHAGSGRDRNQLFRDFFKTEASNRAMAHFEKMQQTVATTNSAAERKALRSLAQAGANIDQAAFVAQSKLSDLTHHQLVSFFVMTSYAASTMMGSTFEAAYALQSEASRARAGGLYAIDTEARELVGRMKDADGRAVAYDVSLAPQLLRAVVAQGGADAGAAKGLLARYEPYNETHARLSGTYLVLQQMAREAIKPKGGSDQLDTVLGLSAKNKHQAIASGLGEANKGERAIALDWFHTLVTGKGMLVDPTNAKNNLRRVTADGGYEEYANGTWNTRSAGQVYTALGEGLYDYHKERVGALYANKALDAASLRGQFGVYGELPEGLEAFEDVKASRERAQQLLAQAERGSGAEGLKWDLAHQAQRKLVADRTKATEEGTTWKENENTLGAYYQRAVLDRYVRNRAYSQAASLMEDAKAGRAGRETKMAYMRALHSGDPGQFRDVAGTMLESDKLFVLNQVVSRGKFDSSAAGDMERAMADLFGHYGASNPEAEAKRLKDDAFRASGNRYFADSLSQTFEHWAKGSDLQAAVRRGMAFTRANYDHMAGVHGYADTLRSALIGHHEAAGTLSPEGRALLTADLDPLSLAKQVNAAEKHSERENLGVTGAAGDRLLAARVHTEAALAYDDSTHLGKGGPVGVESSSQGHTGPRSAAPEAVAARNSARADAAHRWVGTSAHGMGLVGAVGAMGFAAWSAAGSPAQAAESNDASASAAGEAAASLLLLADPKAMLRQASLAPGTSRGDRMAGVAVTAASLAVGAAAGHYAYQHGVTAAVSTLEKAGLEAGEHMTARAGAYGVALSALAGLAGATVGGTLATAIAQRFGYLKGINPVPEAIAALSEFGMMGADTGAFMSEVDELAGVDEQAASGIVEILDAEGQVVAQEFYTFTPGALDDNGELDAVGMLEGDLDAHVSAGGFDSNTVRGSDSLALAKDLKPEDLE